MQFALKSKKDLEFFVDRVNFFTVRTFGDSFSEEFDFLFKICEFFFLLDGKLLVIDEVEFTSVGFMIPEIR